jgi:hypothetical protein
LLRSTIGTGGGGFLDAVLPPLPPPPLRRRRPLVVIGSYIEPFPSSPSPSHILDSIAPRELLAEPFCFLLLRSPFVTKYAVPHENQLIN